MGKASSSKKVARAARAAGRPGAKKSYAWPFALGIVVVVGVALVILSFGGGSTTSAPKVGDHWHAAYGVYDCDHYVAPFPQEAKDALGIHTHGEGLMHIHPFSSRVAGAKANIAAFANDVQLKVNDTSFLSLSPALDRKNGDKCGTKVGHVELVTWSSPTDTTPTVRTKDIAKYAPKDHSVWALAFVPNGAKVPLPPTASNLSDPLAAEEGRQTPTGATPTTAGTPGTAVPGGPTTIPPENSSTTAKP